MQKIRKFIVPALSVLLTASLILNIYLATKQPREPDNGIIAFQNANSRDTWFTVHNVNAAHAVSTGEGVKVGVMDWFFGYGTHPDLYEDVINFSDHESAIDMEYHGLWMACALREIAPDCTIYGLCVTDNDEDKKTDNMIKAIDWAIENDIDVLTYSNSEFSEKNRPRIDEAVNRAIDHGIVTTFIHYDHPDNLLPDGFFDFSDYGREADVNILHYDYNVLFQSKYETFMEINGDWSKIESGDDIPYLSMSSTSPVLAGFVAILKSVNPDLSPAQYRDILVKTGYQTEYHDWGFGSKSTISHVADIGRAVEYLEENYPRPD